MADDADKLKNWSIEAGLLCGRPPLLTGFINFEKPIRAFNMVELVDCSIGAYSYFGSDTRIARTKIGRYASIGGGVRIGLSKHPLNRLTSSPVTYKNIFDDRLLRGAQPFIEYDWITIGHDVWIGERSIVMDGVNIGTGAIIGAGSVVTKNVDPYTIVAGAPAKPIRLRFSEKIIERLLLSVWWNYDLISLNASSIPIVWDDPIESLEAIIKASSNNSSHSINPSYHTICRDKDRYVLKKTNQSLFT